MRRIFFLLMLVFSVQSHALPEISGKILTIAVGPSLGGSNASVVLVRVEGHDPNAAWSKCSNAYWSFTFDASTPAGKTTHAQLLTAYTTGKPVVIQATGSCGWDNTINVLSYTRFVE